MSNSKGKGLLSYLLGWVGGLIVLFAFKDNNRKDVIHACQAITMGIANVVLSIALAFVDGILAAVIGMNISILSSLASIFFFVMMIIGIVKVCKDDPDPKLPIIGDITMSIFGGRINAAPETVTPAGTVTPKFDPNTGKPINPQPQANFDPNTGKPITQPQANFDPNTGQPLNNNAPTTSAPETTAPTDSNNAL